jgi:hypothetical protein
MKRYLLAPLCLASGLAFAADVGDGAFFGRIDIRAFPGAQVVYARPMQVLHGSAAGAGAEPVYLHVRPGEERRWGAHCRAYDVCATPVFFVTESWYRTVYLPLVGGSDGREKRYADSVRIERQDRESRHRQDD